MSTSIDHLKSTIPDDGDDGALPALLQGVNSPALLVMLNEKLFNQASRMAKILSGAVGMVPPHLVGKPEACFAVVVRSLTWKLDPFAVAMSTYATPGGKVGFEGKLCQAIIENSGQVKGNVRFEHYWPVEISRPAQEGVPAEKITCKSCDEQAAEAREKGWPIRNLNTWASVTNKWRKQKSERGSGEFAVRTWTDQDALGLGVKVSAQVKNELDPREWTLDLLQCFPMNSTLWATDPRTQICYTGVRRFASVAMPGIFMGVPFDREDVAEPWDNARDITPGATPEAPSARTFRKRRAPEPAPLPATGGTGGTEPAAEPDAGEEVSGEETIALELFDDLGELLSAQPDPLVYAKMFLELFNKKGMADANRATLIENNKATVESIYQHLPSDVVIALQAAVRGEDPAKAVEQTAAEVAASGAPTPEEEIIPMIGVVPRKDGRPAWAQIITTVATNLESCKTVEAVEAAWEVLEPWLREEKCPTGTGNSIKLAAQRRKAAILHAAGENPNT